MKEIEIFITHYYGGAYRELSVNLRALYRAYVTCRTIGLSHEMHRCDAVASSRKSTGPKAVGQPDLREFIMREVMASLRKTNNTQPATEQVRWESMPMFCCLHCM